MSEDLNKLRELAESLQAGSAGFVRSRDFLNARHDFIDAANPAVILDLFSRLQAAEERAEKVEGAWSWLASNTNLELDHRYLDEDDHGGTWRVHRVNGNVNDREWTLVARGRTPLEAVQRARAAALVNGEAGR